MSTIKLRGDTASAWALVNPTLAAREVGLELDATGRTERYKIGDGVTPWGDLPYFGGGADAAALIAALTEGQAPPTDGALLVWADSGTRMGSYPMATSPAFDLEAIAAGEAGAIPTADQIRASFAPRPLAIISGTAHIELVGGEAGVERVLTLDDFRASANITTATLAGDGSEDGLIGYPLTVHVVTTGSATKSLTIARPYLADPGFPETIEVPASGALELVGRIMPSRAVKWAFVSPTETRAP